MLQRTLAVEGLWATPPDRECEPTLASEWHAASREVIADDLLDWPPDLFALTNVLLTRSEAFRFALSPVQWPPEEYPDWGRVVEAEGLRWAEWVADRRGPLPELVAQAWAAFKERAGMPLEHLAQGLDSRLCLALLTLHAMADEACAGLGVALDTSDGTACVYRARGREMLVRTGSMSRVDPRLLRVLPKVRTPPTGRPAFSRYACVERSGIEARWHKIPARHRGTDLRSEHATLLLLPWPLEVKATDFRPVESSVQRLVKDPFGFFEFAPAEGLDLDLLDRVLLAARDEAGSVDVVCLPESAVEEGEIDGLEALLYHHGVVTLVAGVRQQSAEHGRAPNNWLHMGFNPELQKGRSAREDVSPPWFHIRQRKHHRWSLDEAQIRQYHLGGVLHPHVRWWESMEVPRRSVQFVEVAELTLASLVCEDLAQNDAVAELIRSVGPTAVLTVLLDGPQLTSRWAARYASVLADDPGSAVLTLTSHGMVQRSRPHGRDASEVVALWKDPSSGAREIPLEAGAQAVLLTMCMDRATRRSADGRIPVDNGTHCFDVAVYQVRAPSTASLSPPPPARQAAPHVLEGEELSVLTSWAEAVVEVVSHAPERTMEVLADGQPGVPWRAAMGLPEPSGRLAAAMESMQQVVSALDVPDGEPMLDTLLATAQDSPDEDPLDGLVLRVLLAMLEERRTRQPGGTPADGTRA